ncbi:MAG: recombinase family protein [Pseudomonadota bacterium]
MIERDGFRPTARRLGYIRVSTSAQLTDRQVMQLEAECDELRIEHVSAVAAARPVFDALMTELERGDTLVVVDLDRAFRSSIDAIMTAEALRERGIHFQLLNFPLDTASEEGELFYTILAAFAQFERRIISRRTREGLDAARRRGVRLGRPPSLSPDLVREAHNWLTEAGLPCAYVAALLGVSRLTLQRRFRRLGLPYPITPPAVGLDENPGPTNPQE